MQFPMLLLAEFYWKINPKAVHGISGNATGWISLENTSKISGNAGDWISLENKSHVWTWNWDMEFLIMLLPGFQCEINPMTGCGISDIAAGWISL
jgi:hypothetical protein